MSFAVYALATLVSGLCAILLLRGYKAGGHRLLLWCGISLAGLTLTNLLVFFDLIVFARLDFYPYRLVSATVSTLILLYGLVQESE